MCHFTLLHAKLLLHRTKEHHPTTRGQTRQTTRLPRRRCKRLPMPSGGLTGELRPPRRLETAKARGCTNGTKNDIPAQYTDDKRKGGDKRRRRRRQNKPTGFRWLAARKLTCRVGTIRPTQHKPISTKPTPPDATFMRTC